MTTIRYSTFPRTEPPPAFIENVAEVFRLQEKVIATEILTEHLKSDEVLAKVASGLRHIGFEVEKGKRRDEKVHRPVFFGENGRPTLRFEVDAYHRELRCGLEIEGIRAIRGGAFYRDLIQAMVMTQVDHLIVAVPNRVTWGKAGVSKCYEEGVRTADAIYGHSRIKMPYSLLIIGY